MFFRFAKMLPFPKLRCESGARHMFFPNQCSTTWTGFMSRIPNCWLNNGSLERQVLGTLRMQHGPHVNGCIPGFGWIWYLCRLSGELVFTAMRRYVAKDQTCLFCGIPLTLAHLIHVSVLNPTLTIRTIGSRLKYVSQPLPLCKRVILVLGTVLGCLAMLGPKYYMADLVVCFAILFPP
jgi:hypothetical protein